MTESQIASEVVRLDGHVVDSLLLAKVLDAIVDAGATYRIVELDVGTTSVDPSHVRLEVTASDEESLDALLADLQVHGVNRVDASDAELAAADMDGVLPEGFYSTTNLPTSVRIAGHWVHSGRPEMDCALVVDPSGAGSGAAGPDGGAPGSCRCTASGRVTSSCRLERRPSGDPGTRSRRPGLRLHDLGGVLREAEGPLGGTRGGQPETSEGGARRGRRPAAGRILAVCGPAVVHTGAAPALARMVKDGWVDLLFAGNGFATHDIESSVLGTSLGVSLGEGLPAEHGHANHLRVINEVRRFGSIAAAVEAGWLRSGVLYECVRAGVPLCSAGRSATTVLCLTCSATRLPRPTR